MLKVLAIWGALAMCVGLAVLPTAAAADEIPQAVKDACSGDYKKLCSAHKPESDAARDCMADAFKQLSDPCVTAILDSDLVDKQAQPVKPETRVAETSKAKRSAAKVGKVRVARAEGPRAQRRNGGYRPDKVARYINRGTKIANFYVSKAFAVAFR